MGRKRAHSLQSECFAIKFAFCHSFSIFTCLFIQGVDEHKFHQFYIFLLIEEASDRIEMIYPDRFIKEPSKRTPHVLLEPGRMFMLGRSIPDNPGDFYRPIHTWITEYIKSNPEKTRIEMGFEYINTSSTKWIFVLLKELAGIPELHRIVSITWYYEQGDDDMLDLGYILRSLIECPFTLQEVEEMNDDVFHRILEGAV